MLQRSFISKSALFVFIFILGVPLLSFSQGELTWFDAPKKVFFAATEYHDEIYTIVLRNRNSLLIEKRTANFDLLKTINFKFKINTQKPVVQKFLTFNDKLYVISTSRSFGNYTTYISEFDTKNLTIGKTIFEYLSAEIRFIFNDINIVSAISPSGKYLVLTGIKKQKRKEPHFADIYLFDSNFRIIHQYKSDIEIVNGYQSYPEMKKVEVDNEGNVFFMTTEDVKKRRRVSYVNATFVSITNKGEEHKSVIQLKENLILRDANFTIFQNNIYISGLYSRYKFEDTKNMNPVRGTFFIKKEKKSKSKTSPTCQPFSQKISHASLKNVLQKRLEKTGDIREIENLRIKEMLPWEDRILIVTEVFYAKKCSSEQNCDNYVIQKDIIVLSYDLEGKLIWTNNILKGTKMPVATSSFNNKFLYGNYIMNKKKGKVTFYYYVPHHRLLDNIEGDLGQRKKPEESSFFWTTMNYATGKKETGLLKESPTIGNYTQITQHKWFFRTQYSLLKKDMYGILNAE